MARRRSLFEMKVPEELPKKKPDKTPTTKKPVSEWNVFVLTKDSTAPQPWVPIEFHTDCKKPVRGYRLRNGFITDTPYYVDKFFQSHKVIEWRPILSCADVNKCPQGFPNCDYCSIYKKSKRGQQTS